MYNYVAMPLTYNDDEQSYVSNVSFRSITPNNKYTCDIHHVFFYQDLCPTRKLVKRCIECLRKSVCANVVKNQVITPDYNYIFPMICDRCSIRLKICKWCRPSDHKFIALYDDTV